MVPCPQNKSGGPTCFPALCLNAICGASVNIEGTKLEIPWGWDNLCPSEAKILHHHFPTLSVGNPWSCFSGTSLSLPAIFKGWEASDFEPSKSPAGSSVK